MNDETWFLRKPIVILSELGVSYKLNKKIFNWEEIRKLYNLFLLDSGKPRKLSMPFHPLEADVDYITSTKTRIAPNLGTVFAKAHSYFEGYCEKYRIIDKKKKK